jgi:hypothetical protein
MCRKWAHKDFVAPEIEDFVRHLNDNKINYKVKYDQ